MLWLPKLRRQSAHFTSLSAATVWVFSSSQLLVTKQFGSDGNVHLWEGQAHHFTRARPSDSTITFICLLTPVPFTFLCWASHIGAGSREAAGQQHQDVTGPAGNYLQPVVIKVNSGSAKADRQSWEMPELRSPMQTALNHLVPIYYDTAPNYMCTCKFLDHFWTTFNVYVIPNF